MSEENYNSIVNKYNRLVAHFRDLEQQTAERQKKWDALEEQYKTNESITRELCELILAKDPKEMVLGSSYSWSKLSIRDLVQKSKIVFEKYNDGRTELLRKIQEQSEERRQTIESLTLQLEQEKNRQRSIDAYRAGSDDDDEVVPAEEDLPAYDEETGEVAEPVSPQKLSEALSDKAMQRVAWSAQKAAESGNIELCREDSDGYVVIEEDDRDVSETDIRQQCDMARTSAAVNVERANYKIEPAPKKKQAAQAARADMTHKLVQVDISDTESRMDGRKWLLLEIIGTTGKCEGQDLTDALIAEAKERSISAINTNAARYILKQLTAAGVLIMDSDFNHPTKSRFAVYSLSDIGRRLYYLHFSKEAVLSERNIMIAEHDNLEHAFGIKTLKEILEASGNYTSVSMERSANTIDMKDGSKYIPDIIASGTVKSGTFKAYFEYERGTHHQSDFSIKLNKMVKMTRWLNIVCPNKETVENLRDKTSAWIESRGGAKQLQNVRVRITTLKRLEGQTRINDDSNWQVVFDLRHGTTPIER